MLPPGYQDYPDLDLYAYIYRYDYLDRLVYKKLPGCSPSYLVYDAAHRLVFSQDGCQRNDSLWPFFVYDVYERVVVEGECSNSDKHVRTAGETVVLGTLMEGDTSLAYSGYQSSSDLVDPCVYVVNYYDTYDFRTRNGFSAYNFPEGTVSAIGNLTGSILCTHGSSGFIYSADYYDINKRIVKSLSSRVNGGMDTYATEYSFQGSPLSVLHTHTDSSGYSLTERYTYTYDHSSRLTRVSHQYDNNPSVLLLEHAYDELGRLQTDKLDNGIYATDYAYNIRNWLTGIEGGKFSQSLHYTDGLGVPCYNGNISSMTWKSGAGATPRGYKFSYDRLGRLTDAEYGEGPSLSVNTNRFNEQVTGYDKMGNILGLKRYGQTSATGYDVIDDLSLSYVGNRLKKVADRSGTSTFNNGFEFKDGIDLSTEYEYDENGNLTKDLNKNITAIQYNCLNLPSRVMFANGNSISYLYDAAGRKLRTVHVLEGDSVITDYCGNVVYENGVPQILLTEVGYVSLTDGQYHYYLKDHQGNNRVVVDEEGTVEEVNHYYPFGGVFSSTGDAQPYKYNGKELDRKGGLDWYDYGARHYDSVLGRWNGVDPSCEKHYSWSPYVYCKNNPVLRIDPDGKDDYVINYHGQLQLMRRTNRIVDVLYASGTSGTVSKINPEWKNIKVFDKSILPALETNLGNNTSGADYFAETSSAYDAANIATFGIENTGVEWKYTAGYRDGEKKYIIGNSSRDYSVSTLEGINNNPFEGFQPIVDIHSHPSTQGASEHDMLNAKGKNGVSFGVYFKDNKTLYEYNSVRSNLNSIKMNSMLDLMRYTFRKYNENDEEE